MFEGALRKLRATYIGYHGWAGEWLRENPDLTRRLANLSGYWYFPRRARFPERVRAGETLDFALQVENRGVAPAYNRYPITLRLRGANGETRQTLTDFDNRTWMPDAPFDGTARIRISANLKAGQYSVEIGMFDGERAIKLAIKSERVTANGFYRLGEVAVRR